MRSLPSRSAGRSRVGEGTSDADCQRHVYSLDRRECTAHCAGGLTHVLVLAYSKPVHPRAHTDHVWLRIALGGAATILSPAFLDLSVLASPLPPPPRYKSTRSDARCTPPLATSERATRCSSVQCEVV